MKKYKTPIMKPVELKTARLMEGSNNQSRINDFQLQNNVWGDED